MSLMQSLAAFQADAAQCNHLIVNAHRVDTDGNALFAALDQNQISVAAFLNLFVAWESFLEDVLAQLMTGERTISGQVPTRFVIPPSLEAARAMTIGVQRYFDYGQCDNVRRLVSLYFDRGYPFEPHLGAVASDLADMKTMRNASAHISSTTRAALEGLAQRILASPRPGIDLYSLLISVDPRSGAGYTVFEYYRSKLLVVASLIATG